MERERISWTPWNKFYLIILGLEISTPVIILLSIWRFQIRESLWKVAHTRNVQVPIQWRYHFPSHRFFFFSQAGPGPSIDPGPHLHPGDDSPPRGTPGFLRGEVQFDCRSFDPVFSALRYVSFLVVPMAFIFTGHQSDRLLPKKIFHYLEGVQGLSPSD